MFLQDSESLLSSDVETVHAALLKVFRDLRQAERYEVVNPSVLKHMFAKHQESFWGCMQQVFRAPKLFNPLCDFIIKLCRPFIARQSPSMLYIISMNTLYNFCFRVNVQDAHEFFCSLIDQVQEDVSSELKKQYSIEADRPKLEDVCPTTQNFR